MRNTVILGLLLVWSVVAMAATPAEFFVSPDGADANAGTKAKPFRTLERARDAVRAVNAVNKDMTGDVVVHVAVGTYAGPLVLTPLDSGFNGHLVVYRGEPDPAKAGGKAVISGGKRISGWEKDVKGIWKAKTDVADFRHVFVNGKRAVRARGDCPKGVERFGELKYLDSEGGFLFPDGAMADWRNPGDIELGEYSSWSHMVVKVDRLARNKDGRAMAYMKTPYFFLASRKEGRQFKLPNYIENAFELLDEPGEWYFDKPAHVVYYLPRADEDMATAEVVVPVLETLLRVEGSVDAPVRNIAFEGITFAEGSWLGPNRIGHVDVQANFAIEPTNLYVRDSLFLNVQNEYIKGPANVVLHAAQGCRFERCEFTRLGGAGINVECGSQENVIVGCLFHDVSGSAIQIGDVLTPDHHPDDPRLVVKKNQVVNNYIHDAGVEYRDSVGVFAGYTDGTVIAHNEICQLPYTGISVGWGWGEPDPGGGNYSSPYNYGNPTPSGNNRIERNHIHHVMLKQDDGGGIYTLSNQPGTVIRENHIHDNGPGGPGGVYLDEGSGFIEVTRNSVYNVSTLIAYNNKAQDRIKTCNEHDDFFDIKPGANGFPQDVADNAGLEAGYRDMLTGK